MMKITITIEDQEYGANVRYEFDPPIKGDEPMTQAGALAAHAMRAITNRINQEQEESEDE